MSQLGPVIGNRFTNAHRATLKPHLRQRLVLQISRTTALGLIAAGPDGRLSFKPSYVPLDGGRPAMPRPVFQPGQRVRMCATMAELLAQEVYPFKPEEAMAVGGKCIRFCVPQWLAKCRSGNLNSPFDLQARSHAHAHKHTRAIDPGAGSDGKRSRW
jgi:hypothetical protein